MQPCKKNIFQNALAFFFVNPPLDRIVCVTVNPLFFNIRHSWAMPTFNWGLSSTLYRYAYNDINWIWINFACLSHWYCLTLRQIVEFLFVLSHFNDFFDKSFGSFYFFGFMIHNMKVSVSNWTGLSWIFQLKIHDLILLSEKFWPDGRFMRGGDNRNTMSVF